jgi:predicted Zn-dependent peptidase
MKRIFPAGLLALCMVVAGSMTPALPQAPSKAPAKAAQPARPKPITVSFQQFTLKNGLRVILSEDHTAPTYSIVVNYDVGSRNERPGRSGFAHLFEHMMFQGSKNIGKGEHFILVENYGGGVNGTTNNDRTVYFETLPSNQLDLGLFLEADRMRALNVTQENLDNQRKAVQEERRLRIDNQPYGPTFLAVDDMAYDNFAYKHSVIGSMEDLNAATLGDVQEFFRIYYAPNNAVLVVVGDIKIPEALAKVKKYFEDIPSQPKPPAVELSEPTQTAERRKTLEDKFARAPLLYIFYKIPPGETKDWYALDVAGDVLVRGQSSRLFQKLVREKRVATGVSGGPDLRRGPSLFTFSVQLTPNATPEEVEKLIYEEVERLKNEPVSEAEIKKIYMQNRRSLAQQFQGTLARAFTLSEAAVNFGDPSLVNKRLEKLAAITAEDVQRVARTYWTEQRRNVLLTVPKPQAAAGGNQ